MRPIRFLFGLWSCGLLISSGLAQEKHPILPGEANEKRADAMSLACPLERAELRKRAEEAYQRGFDFLVSCQNADGSWGSHDPKLANLKNFGFGTANRGSQDGVRIACTAIVAKAFLRKKELSAKEKRVFDRALVVLLQDTKFAYEKGEAFNTWGYGFKLDFLCDYYETDRGRADRERVRAAIAACVAGLKRFQQADGGWNYYAGPLMGGESMSFNTANFAEALFRAEQLGFEVPKGLANDAIRLVLRMRTKRGGFVYDARFMNDGGSVNELSAAARTAACAEALAEMGHMERKELLRSLAVWNEGENWLEHGRKLIQPHTAVHQVSGYFFFYGYHYLSEMLARITEDVPRERWDRNAWTMVRTQEKNGAWWDTPAADYGDKWATGFALLVLARYFEHDVPLAESEKGNPKEMEKGKGGGQ